ncbi:LapA family protein [Sideroxydans sp.]
MMDMKLALILLLSTLAAVFIAQNIAPVEVGFLYWTATISRALLIFFTLLLGFVMGWFLHAFMLHRKNRGRVYLP